MPNPHSQLDAIARQRGFPDYATWAAWNRHRTAGLQQPGATPAPPQNNNFLQNLLAKIPWHPSFLLGYTNDKINKANNGQ